MGHQNLTAEILVPSEWPIQNQHDFWAGVCEHLISIDDPERRVYLKVGAMTTQITRSETTPKFTFEKVEARPSDDTFFVHLMWPERVEVVGPGNARRRTEETLELLPFDLTSNFPMGGVQISGSATERYLTVQPNTKKVLELMGVTGPRAVDWVVKSTYRLRKTTADADTNQDLGPSSSAGSASSLNEDIELIYLNHLPRPQKRYNCKKMMSDVSIVIILLALCLVSYCLYLSLA